MSPTDFNITRVAWREMGPHLRSIRNTVFIEEQQVPIELEWDGQDEDCVHLIVENNGQYIATSRLLDSGQIGRMAVLEKNRHKGIGSAMLETLLEIAKDKKMSSVFLNAQIDAIGFYKPFGFFEQGESFNEAGIMHCRMRKILND